MYYCLLCGRELDEKWKLGYYFEGRQLCPVCFDVARREAGERKTEICNICGLGLRAQDCNTSLGMVLCQSCYKDEVKRRYEHTCSKCKKWIYGGKYITPSGNILCFECYKEDTFGTQLGAKLGCSICGRHTTIKFITEDGTILCHECSCKELEEERKIREEMATCSECKRQTVVKFIKEDGGILCPSCSLHYEKKKTTLHGLKVVGMLRAMMKKLRKGK